MTYNFKYRIAKEMLAIQREERLLEKRYNELIEEELRAKRDKFRSAGAIGKNRDRDFGARRRDMADCD